MSNGLILVTLLLSCWFENDPLSSFMILISLSSRWRLLLAYTLPLGLWMTVSTIWEYSSWSDSLIAESARFECAVYLLNVDYSSLFAKNCWPEREITEFLIGDCAFISKWFFESIRKFEIPWSSYGALSPCFWPVSWWFDEIESSFILMSRTSNVPEFSSLFQVLR